MAKVVDRLVLESFCNDQRRGIELNLNFASRLRDSTRLALNLAPHVALGEGLPSKPSHPIPSRPSPLLPP